MISIFVNNKRFEIEDDSLTIFQALEGLKIKVPHFCYHQSLKISGNCRMCLVEVDGVSKPVPSCVVKIADGMKIKINSEKVIKTRNDVMELLLVNHPLDCPICDQGGECDLQDQAMKYGSLCSKYSEEKRVLSERSMGPMINVNMTRCIHCTRCIRFVDEIAGTSEIIMINRGEKSEITTLGRPIKSELSGNIIDLCPVGALTAAPYKFQYRSWELNYHNTIDVMDAVGSNIRVEYKENRILRILPRKNYDFNDEWISDKTRFSFDGLYNNRLYDVYINKNGQMLESSIQDALNMVIAKLKNTSSKKIAAIAGDMIDCESMFLLKKLMNGIGCKNIDCRQDGSRLTYTSRSQYIMNTPLQKIEEGDLFLLIGTNIRFEAPMVNYRIRKAFVDNNANVFSIGENHNLNYPVSYLGDNPLILQEELDNGGELFNLLRNSKKPVIIVGQGVCTREDADVLLSVIMKLAKETGVVNDEWNGFNVLQCVASRIGGIDIGFLPEEDGFETNKIIAMSSENKIDVLFLFGADEIDFSQLGANTFVIYFGTHKDNGFHRANIAIPILAYTEKSSTYVNVDGRAQRGMQVVFPEKDIVEEWKILVELIKNTVDSRISYNSIDEVVIDVDNILIDKIAKQKWHILNPKNATISSNPIKSLERDFFNSDTITRASNTMIKYREIFS